MNWPGYAANPLDPARAERASLLSVVPAPAIVMTPVTMVIAHVVARGVIRTTRTVVPTVVITCLPIEVPGVVLMGSRVVGSMLCLGHAGAERHDRKRRSSGSEKLELHIVLLTGVS